MNELPDLNDILVKNEMTIRPAWNTEKPVRNGSEWFIGKSWSFNGKTFFSAKFGCFKKGRSLSWSSSEGLTAEERLECEKYISQIVTEENKECIRMHESVALELEKKFQSFATKGSTPYLERKKITDLFGARIFSDANGVSILAVPLRDVSGKIWNFQKISNAGKYFSSGARVVGCFHVLTDFSERKPIYICEGFATAASIQMACPSVTVVSACDAKNLVRVAKAIRLKFPSHQIVICADDDRYTKVQGVLKNIGLEAAKKAAIQIKASILVPKFKNPKEGLTDFNDLHVEEGLEAVSTQVCSNNVEISFGKLKLTSLEGLFQKPPEKNDWLVDDLLASGGTSLIVAKPKIGKSTLVRQLALAVAKGEKFLNRETKQGLVIYLAVEERESEVKKHFQMQGATGKEPIFIQTQSVSDVLQDLRVVTQQHSAVLVILDTLFKIVPIKDGNDYAIVTKELGPIHSLARETGAHVVLVHHAGKGERDGADVILGSTAIFAAVDTAIILARGKDDCRTIRTDQRYGTSIETTILKFDSSSKTMNLGETKKKQAFDYFAKKILECLKLHGVPILEQTIEKECGGNKKHRRAVLHDLVREGEVFKTGTGKKGDPYLFAYKISKAARESVS